MAQANTQQRSKMSAFSRAAMGVQAFLLRRNWLGGMGDFVMVITTTGRKSGRKISTPIGYLVDGGTYIGLTRSGAERSNWFRNLLHNPNASLEIRGRKINVCATQVTDPAERQAIFELYRARMGSNFKLMFGIPADAPTAELQQALADRDFIRFIPE